MGLIIDSGVFVLWERKKRALDLSFWTSYGEADISVITASKLLTAVWRADTDDRRKATSAFVEGILKSFPVKEVTLAVARRHAEVYADLAKRGTIIGAHDLLIAATALHHGYGVLTANPNDFGRVPGLQVAFFS